MKTETKYEEMFLNEIRTIPMTVLPQALKMLRLLKEGVLSVSRHQAVAGTAKTGFCGVWQVTNNMKHFKRIKGLKLENWVQVLKTNQLGG